MLFEVKAGEKVFLIRRVIKTMRLYNRDVTTGRMLVLFVCERNIFSFAPDFSPAVSVLKYHLAFCRYQREIQVRYGTHAM